MTYWLIEAPDGDEMQHLGPRYAAPGALQALFPAWVNNEPPAARAPLRTTDAGFEQSAGTAQR